MKNILNYDPIFRDLYNIQEGLIQSQPHDTLALLNTFKKSLSFQWIQSIKDYDTKSEILKQVIVTVFQYTEDRNTSIRLSAYSTIGSLLLTVAPYSPPLFMTAFANAVTHLMVSPKISIAIINSFMSLMRFISPVRIQMVVEKMPILHHFSADISNFIQFLPKTIPLMKKLPPEFLNRILASLIKACGKAPNGHFSISISLLVSLKRKILLPELADRLIRNDLKIAAVWIGRNIFSDEKNFRILGEKGREYILSNAFDQLNKSPLDLSRFDYSCRIIASAMRHAKNSHKLKSEKVDENYEFNELKRKLQESLLDRYALPYRNALLILPLDAIGDFLHKYTIHANSVKLCSSNQNSINQNSINQNSIDQNSINQNSINQNSINQNSINQNSINQNTVIQNSARRSSLNPNSMKIKSMRQNSNNQNSLIAMNFDQNERNSENECFEHDVNDGCSLLLSLSTSQMFGDNAAYLANKIIAIKNYFLDNIDDVDADKVSSLFFDFVGSQNDLFSSLIENFSLCANELLKKCKCRTHIDIIRIILSKSSSLNWVQQVRIAQMINSINLDLVLKQFPDYPSIVTQILLELTISPTDSLFLEAVDVLCNVATYGMLRDILDKLLFSNWYSEQVVYKRFYLLAKLAKKFKIKRGEFYQNNNKNNCNCCNNICICNGDHCWFRTFVGIAYECLFFCESKQTFSMIFWFLSKINNISYLPNEVKNFAFEFIEKSFFSYAHCPIYEKSYVTDEFSSYDSDIVTNPLINHKTLLNHLKYCYKFLCNLPSFLIPEQKKLYHYSVSLVPIFDKFAIKMAAKLAKGQKKYEDFVWNMSIETFKTTSDDNVAATCANIFVNNFADIESEKESSNTKRIIPENIQQMLQQFIGEKCTENPLLLYICFLSISKNLLSTTNHNSLMNNDKLDLKKQCELRLIEIANSIPNILHLLPINTGTILLYKILSNISGLINFMDLDLIKEEHSFSLLRLANENGGKFSERVFNYIKNHHYCEYPINDINLQKDLIVFLKKIENNNNNNNDNNNDSNNNNNNDNSNSNSNSKKDNNKNEIDHTNNFDECRGKIVLGAPEKLDTEHWIFVFENIEKFDFSSRISSFIEDHPSVFAKIELLSYPSVFEKAFSLPTNVHNYFTTTKKYNLMFASTTPFIVQNLFINSLPLIKSFCMFSERLINDQNLFEKIFNFVFNSRNISAIKELVKYMLKFDLHKTLLVSALDKEKNDGDSIFFNVELIDFTAVIDSNAVLNHLNLKMGPELIIDESISDSLREMIISTNPDYFIDFFLDNPPSSLNSTNIFKKRYYLKLIKLLKNSKFSLEKISDLIVKLISSYKDMSTKKKQVFIRLVTQSVFCLSKNKISSDFQTFINFLTVHFQNMAMGSDTSILLEFSYLFELLAENTKDGTFFVEFLNSIFFNCVSLPPLFLISTTKMISKNVIPVNSSSSSSLTLSSTSSNNSFNPKQKNSNSNPNLSNLNDNNKVDNSLFAMILNGTELPSLNCCAIRCLSNVSVDNDTLKIIENKFDEYKNDFLCSCFLPDFIMKNISSSTSGSGFYLTNAINSIISSNSSNSSFVLEITKKYIDIFLNDPNHPSFNSSLRLLNRSKSIKISSQLTQYQQKIIDDLFNNFSNTSPFIISVLNNAFSFINDINYNNNNVNNKNSFFSFSSSNNNNKQNANSQLIKKYFNQVINYFKVFQKVDVYPLLLNLLVIDNKRTTNALFSELPSKFDNFLVLFCFLRKCFLRSDKNMREAIKKMIELNADQMIPQSRFFSLMMLCENAPHEVNLGFIVAATETNVFNPVAAQYDIVCLTK